MQSSATSQRNECSNRVDGPGIRGILDFRVTATQATDCLYSRRTLRFGTVKLKELRC